MDTYKKHLIENWKYLNKLADERLKQLKELYTYRWYEASLKDDAYRYICWNLAHLKMMMCKYYGWKEPSIIQQAKNEQKIMEFWDKFKPVSPEEFIRSVT